MRSRISSDGAWCATRRSHAPFWSSIIAASEPRATTPWRARTAGSTARGSSPSAPTPSESASRRAGSIVSTTARRPRSAPQSAIAAAVVVLPTPPEPTQMTTRWSRTRASSISASSTPASVRALRGERAQLALGVTEQSAHLGETELLTAEKRQLDGRHRHRRTQAPQVMRVDSRPARLLAAAAQHVDDERRRARRRRWHVVGRERRRVHAIHEEDAERHLEMVAELRVHLARLVDRHLLRGRHRTDRRARGILEQVEDLARLAPDEPGAERLVRRRRHAQVLEAVPRRRRID